MNSLLHKSEAINWVSAGHFKSSALSQRSNASLSSEEHLARGDTCPPGLHSTTDCLGGRVRLTVCISLAELSTPHGFGGVLSSKQL